MAGSPDPGWASRREAEPSRASVDRRSTLFSGMLAKSRSLSPLRRCAASLLLRRLRRDSTAGVCVYAKE